MGAQLDPTGKPYFLLGNDGTESTKIGARKMWPWIVWSFLNERSDQDNKRRSWSVCPHLSSLEDLFDYYMASGSIMVLLGKCLCHDCYMKILCRRDLTEFLESCDHMTDRRFQEDFIDPLFQINREIFRTRRNYTAEETSRWTWIICPDICKEGQLEGLYGRCNPIFFHEGFVTCNECFGIVPSASLYLQTLMDCEAMTDDQLQERVIDHLYPINRKILEAVGHFGR
jgi:hypothetical protein